MTAAARDLLAAFNTLTLADQHQVATEILRQATEGGSLPETAFDELAVELFQRYDAEEADRADP